MIGVDVSSHNGNIDWSALSKRIDFAIIRAGFGNSNYDLKAEYNASMCTLYNVPFGLYWFSYAKDEDEARREAECLYSFNSDHHALFPLCFDWEEDSERYTGISRYDSKVVGVTKSFCNHIENLGGYAMVYTNHDMLITTYKNLTDYDFWIASWKKELSTQLLSPPNKAGIWQITNSAGFNNVNYDVNIAYKNYPKIIVDKKLNL